MSKPLAVVISAAFAIAACSAPPLPPPPSEAQRAAWRSVALDVEAPPPFAIETPPTTFFGRMLVGGERGFLLGGTIGGSAVNPAAGLLGIAVLGVVGGSVGLLVGPFCGDSAEDVEAAAARLTTTATGTSAHERLAADLRREFTVRGARVDATAPVRCEVRVHDFALRGSNDFDPELALVVRGELRMRGAGDVVQYSLPFQWEGAPRRYRAWGGQPPDLARALDESSTRLAAFLADELWCTADASWGARP
jgi:hypothetical protein